MYVWGPVDGFESHVCDICQKPRNHPDHLPPEIEGEVHPFTPDPLDFSNCVYCGQDLAAHQPRCRGLFKDRPFRFTDECDPRNMRCMRCHKTDDACGCPSGCLMFDLQNEVAPDEGETFSNLHKASWDRLRHDAWDGIFSTQFSDPMVCWVVQRVITNMIGRSWFPAGMFDSLQMFVHFLGLGGTGKTIVQNFIKTFFPTHESGIVANNAQRTFPFGVCLNPYTDEPKRCVMFPEIRNDFQVDFTDILRLCEHVKDFVYNLKGRKPVIAVHRDAIHCVQHTVRQRQGRRTGSSCVRRGVPQENRKKQHGWYVAPTFMQARDWRNHSVRQFWISPVSA